MISRAEHERESAGNYFEFITSPTCVSVYTHCFLFASSVSPADFTSLATVLSFDECDTRMCVSITIVDEMMVEMTESFDVTLDRTTSLDSRVTLGLADAVVEITDSDGIKRNVYSIYSNGDKVTKIIENAPL